MNHAPTAARRAAGQGWLILALIAAVSATGSLYWLDANVVFLGKDASAYIHALHRYFEFLATPGPQTLFQVFSDPPYRTPALYLVAYPFYALLGPGPDSAQIVNVLLLTCLIWLTYLLGSTFGGRRAGLAAAFVAGFLPMLTGMARLFYTEMLLTNLVTLNLLALARSDRFGRRNWSLLWGVSLGAGLLTKWTMPIYVALPALWVLAQPAWRSRQRITWRSLRVDGRLAAAAAGGVIFGLAWVLPARSLALTYPLGDWLILAWALLAAMAIYSLLSLRDPAWNLWAALLLAAWLASLWYLPHLNFVQRLLEVDAERGQQQAGLLYNLHQYALYFSVQNVGPLLTALMAPFTALAWLWAWRRGRTPAQGALLWLSLLSAVSVLALLSQRSPRNLAPCLPVFAVLAAVALTWLPRNWACGLGAAWAAVLLLQWSSVTFDAAAAMVAAWPAPALWASSEYALPPASGRTDPGYAAGPRLIRQIAAAGPDVEELGVLANTEQIHAGILKYQAHLVGAGIEIADLTDAAAAGWPAAVASQWLLFKDGSNDNVEAPGQAVLQAIAEHDPLFDSLYTEQARYVLPDGDTLYLFHRDQGPNFNNPADERTLLSQQIGTAVQAAASTHSTLLYGSPKLAAWVGPHVPQPGRQVFLPAEQAVNSEMLRDRLPITGAVLAVLDVDSSEIEKALDAVAYRSRAIGDDALSAVIYGMAAPLPAVNHAPAVWQDVRLASVGAPQQLWPGEVLPLDVTFAGQFDANVKVSYRLTGADGEIVDANDRPLARSDRLGLFAPPGTPAGVYTVTALLYDGATLAVQPDVQGSEAVALFTVMVGGE